MRAPIPPERVVRPRKHGFQRLPIIAVDGDKILTEYGRGDFSDLVTFLRGKERSMIAVQGADRLLFRLDEIFRHAPHWQFRVSPTNRQKFDPSADDPRPTQIRQVTVSFFGFTRKNGHGENVYHYPIDPHVLTNRSVHTLYPEEGETLIKLFYWAYDVREFLERHDLPIRPTSGGVASALLKDPRFYPNPRRKVPRLTNDRARDHLPGNFYQLFAPSKERFNAVYLDQTKAHHTAARNLAFPDANHLYAVGAFKGDGEWRLHRDRIPDLANCPGMIYARVTVPHLPRHAFVPHFMRRPGRQTAMLFTNEIPWLLENGMQFESVLAGWLSHRAETGLNRYAEWAIEELDESEPDRRLWLKPLLLAAYGMLAARPRQLESGYRQAKNGKVRYYPAGAGLLEVCARTTSREIELPIVNAIHRGMIEAETRDRSLRMAAKLHSEGRRVLAVYADSVFVEDAGLPIPLLEHPWKVEAVLTDLEFHSPTSFTSRELSKLPGIPRNARFRHMRRMQIRACNSDRDAVGSVR